MQITHERVGDGILVHIRDELGHHEARKAIHYLENIAVIYPDSHLWILPGWRLS